MMFLPAGVAAERLLDGDTKRAATARRSRPFMKIPCLSIQQPWATCIVAGVKPYENRTWYSTYRGPLLIHAGLRWHGPAARPARLRLLRALRRLWRDIPDLDLFEGGPSYPTGAIIGIATMTDCLRCQPRPASPWFSGPCGFKMERAQRIPAVPYKGGLSFFKVPIDSLGDAREVVACYLGEFKARAG